MGSKARAALPMVGDGASRIPVGTAARSEKFLVAARTQKPQQTGGTNRRLCRRLLLSSGRWEEVTGYDAHFFSNIFLPPSS